MLILLLSLHNVTARSVANAMVVKMPSLILKTGVARTKHSNTANIHMMQKPKHEIDINNEPP
jgi:hypothetical protein